MREGARELGGGRMGARVRDAWTRADGRAPRNRAGVRPGSDAEREAEPELIAKKTNKKMKRKKEREKGKDYGVRGEPYAVPVFSTTPFAVTVTRLMVYVAVY